MKARWLLAISAILAWAFGVMLMGDRDSRGARSVVRLRAGAPLEGAGMRARMPFALPLLLAAV